MHRRLNTDRRATRAMLLGAGSVAVGVHAGLAPEHLHEWAPLGASFIAAAVITAAAVAAVALRPKDPQPTQLLTVVLAGLVVAYLLTRLVALPPLDPDREPFDSIGLATVTAELAGLAAGLRLLSRPTTTARTPFVLGQGGNR
jgi:hypothetical protein